MYYTFIENLQIIFYVLGIVVMLSWILLLIGVAVALWKIRRSARQFKENVVDRATDFVNSGKMGMASTVGLAVSSFIFRKLRRVFRR